MNISAFSLVPNTNLFLQLSSAFFPSVTIYPHCCKSSSFSKTRFPFSAHKRIVYAPKSSSSIFNLPISSPPVSPPRRGAFALRRRYGLCFGQKSSQRLFTIIYLSSPSETPFSLIPSITPNLDDPLDGRLAGGAKVAPLEGVTAMTDVTGSGPGARWGGRGAMDQSCARGISASNVLSPRINVFENKLFSSIFCGE